MEEEVNIFSALPTDMIISILIGLLSTAVFLYCFLSLRKSGKIAQLKHLSYFAVGFLLYFIGNILNYTVLPVMSLVSAGGGLDGADVVTDVIYYLLNFGAAVYFFMGARAASEHVRA
ncbi:hypothetical protein [Microbulbifer celer]|uniref:Uncharacterized protein n=1 Tax=Microbulbifer celer TaxID=435905 RepID=A0ABW3UCJ1_9GAMM|nr:hypothetical protein [Microbulbifer celer]UFN56029.1 hypothetical protein LPW13_10615 [Microbulbifer celer]